MKFIGKLNPKQIWIWHLSFCRCTQHQMFLLLQQLACFSSPQWYLKEIKGCWNICWSFTTHLFAEWNQMIWKTTGRKKRIHQMNVTFPKKFRLFLIHDVTRNCRVIWHFVLLHVLEHTSLCYLLYDFTVQRFIQKVTNFGHRILQIL